MTNNQIKLREAKEQERSNRANEEIKRDQLAETIENDLRNYRINLDKNAIQRLYNKQLNDRELQKIANTLQVDLGRLANDAVSNSIKDKANKLQVDIANARNATSLQTAAIAALSGLLGGIIKNANDKDKDNGKGGYSDAQMTQIIEEINRSENSKSNIANFFSGLGIAGLLSGLLGTPAYGGDLPSVSQPSQMNENPTQKAITEAVKNINEWAKEPKEKVKYEPVQPAAAQVAQNIPAANFNNDVRPGSSIENAIVVPSANNGPGQSSKRDYEERDRSSNSSTSGGTDYHIEGGHHSSGTIISPGAHI